MPWSSKELKIGKLDYERCESMLGRTHERLLNRRVENGNTWLMRGDGCHYVRYHNTNILTFYPDGRVVVRFGGWHTQSTRLRMNELGGLRISASKSLSWAKDRWGLEHKVNDGDVFVDGVLVVDKKPNFRVLAQAKRLLGLYKGLHAHDLTWLYNKMLALPPAQRQSIINDCLLAGASLARV